MRIGIVTYCLSAGGVSNFVLSLSKYFVDHGHIVEIITESERGVWFYKTKEIACKGISFSPGILEWIPLGTIVYSRKVGRYLKNQHFDVILLNHCKYAQTAASLFCRNSIVVSAIHNNSKGVYQVAAKNIQCIDAVTCGSPATMQGAEKFIPKDKLACIPYGIPIPQLNIIKKPSEAVKILFVGRLEHYTKGVLFIPDILKQLFKIQSTPFQLSIVGEGCDSEKLCRQLKENGVMHIVNFEGTIDLNELYSLYNDHHVLISLSLFEGLPFSIIEAMARGCVPVVSRLPGVTDFIIKDGECGFLADVGNVGQYVNILSDLISHPEKLSRMSRAAVVETKERFSVSRMGKDYLELFNKLMQNPSRHVKARLRLTWSDFLPEKLCLLLIKLKNKLK